MPEVRQAGQAALPDVVGVRSGGVRGGVRAGRKGRSPVVEGQMIAAWVVVLAALVVLSGFDWVAA